MELFLAAGRTRTDQQLQAVCASEDGLLGVAWPARGMLCSFFYIKTCLKQVFEGVALDYPDPGEDELGPDEDTVLAFLIQDFLK